MTSISSSLRTSRSCTGLQNLITAPGVRKGTNLLYGFRKQYETSTSRWVICSMLHDGCPILIELLFPFLIANLDSNNPITNPWSTLDIFLRVEVNILVHSKLNQEISWSTLFDSPKRPGLLQRRKGAVFMIWLLTSLGRPRNFYSWFILILPCYRS